MDGERDCILDARAHTHIRHETLVSVKQRGGREMHVERVCILKTRAHTHTHMA